MAAGFSSLPPAPVVKFPSSVCAQEAVGNGAGGGRMAAQYACTPLGLHFLPTLLYPLHRYHPTLFVILLLR